MTPKGQAHFALIRKATENEQTFPSRKLIYKLDIKKLYPLPANAPLLTYNITVTRTKASPNFKSKYYFGFEQDNLYFFTSVNQPATLKVNIYLNSTIRPGVADFRKYSKIFYVRGEKPRKSHVFELKVKGEFGTILKLEKAILNQFESELWKGGKPSLAYIKPANRSFQIGIANSLPHSNQLEEFCFLNEIPPEHFSIADLEVDRSDAQCQIVEPVQNQPPAEFVVNAFVKLVTKSLTGSRTDEENDLVFLLRDPNEW